MTRPASRIRRPGRQVAVAWAVKRIVTLTVTVAGIAIALGLAAAWLPPAIWPDATIPPALAPYISAARQHLWAEGIDGLRLPLHLTFVEARCADDGSVALIFEEHRPPYVDRRFAYASRGSMPAAPDDAWSGGYGISGSVLDEAEFIHLMGIDPRPCDG